MCIRDRIDTLDIRDSVRKKLAAGEESARLSYELATIRCDAPVEVEPEEEQGRKGKGARTDGVKMTAAERREEIAKLEKKMREAAKMLEFEYAALLRDQLIKLRGEK